MKVKWITDLAMTAALLLLMAYELVGQAAHEWIGVAMFVLFIFHHVLNSKWSRTVLKGKYTVLRGVQTGLAAAILLTMLSSMFSGIILSRHVFSFLSVRGLRSFARNLHMVSAYWGFVLMSLHLGLHWNMMIGIGRKLVGNPSASRTWILRMISFLIAGYGVYAFAVRKIGSYMLFLNQFVFFDFDQPIVFFMIDYMAIMGLFVFLGHYLAVLLRHCNQKKKE